MDVLDEAVVKRIPPHSTEAEKSVLVSMLTSPDAVVVASEVLTAEDFYHQQYGIVFQTICEMTDAGKPVDAITLQEKLREKSLPEDLAGMDFLRDLLSSSAYAANVRSYAEIVRNKAILRRLIGASQKIENDCFLETKETSLILEETEKNIFRILQQRTVDDGKPFRELVIDALRSIEIAAQTRSTVTGLPSGFKDLDAKTAGFQPSDLILIATRPSMGKSAFAMNIVTYLAVRQQLPVAFFSLEMSQKQLITRLFSTESRIDAQKLRIGQLSSDEWRELANAASRIGKSQIFMDDIPGISISELRTRARKYKLDHDIKAIFIDYLQLMSGSGSSDNRQQQISDISRALKSLARELNIPVIALSQLNRSVEQREDHRPILSDLRESGAIEQDADVVMFLYRDDYYHKDTDEPGIAEVIIAKQRNGPTGTVKLAWLQQYAQFANLDKEKMK